MANLATFDFEPLPHIVSNSKKKSFQNVLISPLNWGLGHATRCIPIIEEYLTKNWEVVIGGNGESFSFLSSRFPELKSVTIPGVEMKYSGIDGLNSITIGTQLNQFRKFIKQEHAALEKLLVKSPFSLVITPTKLSF